jgi:putative Mg2+ transporter-C (MgtC) family protein
MLTDIDICVRILLGAALSGVIGYEREHRGRIAGLRTHILVGTGATLVMLTGIGLFELYRDVTTLDPARLGAQVVSGIGFLGAGAIMRSKVSIRGLTTAAGLWAVAGVGLAVGSGFYLGAITATVVVFLTLYALTQFEPRYRRKGTATKQGGQ